MASLTGHRGLWFHLRDQNSFTTNLEFSQSLSIRSNTFNIYTNIIDEGNGGGEFSSRFTNFFFTDYSSHEINSADHTSHVTRNSKVIE
jgi:hypothetical protein